MSTNKNKGFIAVFLREWHLICRRRIFLLAMIVLPIIAMISLLSIMNEGLPKNLPLAVVDMDNTATSRAIIRNLNAMDQTEVVLTTNSFTEARKSMQNGEIYAIIEIPKDFTKDLMSAKRPIIHSYSNNAFMMAGGLLYRDLRLISELASAKAILENNLARGKDEKSTIASIMPIKVEAIVIGNQSLNYSMYLNNNLLLGILQLFILQITVFSISLEIKHGKGKELLELADGSITNAILGKLSLHTIIFFFTGVLSLFLLYGYEGFTLMNGFIPMILLLILFIIATQSLGVLFVTLLPSPRLSLSLASLFGMLSFSMAAFSFPATSMYSVIRGLTYLFPLRYYNLIYIDQALTGNPFVSSLNYYVLLALFVILIPISKKILKKELLELSYIK